ncbi:DoxX family protein, partial [Streptomyces leeuwenhoekii]|uniref:DoxX family protein n=1 Tax=Streptomyces leeuwenhoekii TaxID=1437453 RepID=UPI000997BBE8
MERVGERGPCPPAGPAPEGSGDGGRAARTVRSLAGRVQRSGPGLLRVCVGTVFLWFGALKFFPAASPAEQVAVEAATKVTFGLLPPDLVLRLLAASETAIGLGLVTGVLLRVALEIVFKGQIQSRIEAMVTA